MRRNIIVTIIIIMFAPIALEAQRSTIAKGDSYFESFYYDLAKDEYEKALSNAKLQDEKAEVAYKLGICYKNLGDSEKSEIKFAIAVKNYQQGGYVKPDVLLYYADAQKTNGKYEDAIKTYQKYVELVPDDYRGKAGVASCKVAPNWNNRRTKYKVINTAKFNSSSFDFSPAFATKDNKTIYFTSSREGTTGSDMNNRSGQRFTDIFETSIDRKGVWSTPEPIDGAVNTIDDEGAMVISPKGNDMYYTQCIGQKKKDEPCKIFYTAKKGNAWGAPEVLVLQGFEGFEVGYPALSPDGKILYFSANSPEGYGGMDIYMARRIGNDPKSFERPINLGPIVNTIGNEVYPTVNSNGILYFSSDAHEGLGGLDIFKTIADENGNITGIENLKPPFNSSFDDFGIIFDGKKQEGYFSSNRKGGKGSDDIYSFALMPIEITVTGTVRDTTDIAKVKLIRGAKIKINTDAGLIGDIESDEKGSFTFKLQENTNYKITAVVDEFYFNNSLDLSTMGIEFDTVINISMNMAQIPRIIELPNIYYDYDKATLKPESNISLDGLVKTLNDNPKITIELRSHTDYRGNDDYNMKLSQDRAKSCVDYLIGKGIDSVRLTARGMGESEPKIIDEKLAAQYPFFKVGDVLTEKFITELPKDKQEIANQINRRTDFSVLSKDYSSANLIDEEALEEENQIEEKQGDAKVNDTGNDF